MAVSPMKKSLTISTELSPHQQSKDYQQCEPIEMEGSPFNCEQQSRPLFHDNDVAQRINAIYMMNND